MNPPTPTRTPTPRCLKVLCVDEDNRLMALLSNQLAMVPRFAARCYGVSPAAAERAAPWIKPDVVVLEGPASGRDPRPLAARLAQAGLRVAVLGALPEPEEVRACIDVGVLSVMRWNEPDEVLAQGLRAVADGQHYLSLHVQDVLDGTARLLDAPTGAAQAPPEDAAMMALGTRE